MGDILNSIGTAISYFAKNILAPVIAVCGLYALVLYILTKLVPIKSVRARKVLRAISKPPLMVFRFLGGLPEIPIILIGAAAVGVLGLIGVIALGYLSGGANAFVFALFLVGLLAGAAAFGLFCILLACKGFAAALGYVYAELGDWDTYVDTVKDIGGKFIVYADEDPSLYPEDMITRSSETSAEAEARRKDLDEARNREYKEQREAQRRYLQAKKRYDSASFHYRGAMSRGDAADALRWKSIMDQSLIDMNISGFKGV